MKPKRQQADRPQWTREQMNAADWTPEQLRAARERWEQGEQKPRKRGG